MSKMALSKEQAEALYAQVLPKIKHELNLRMYPLHLLKFRLRNWGGNWQITVSCNWVATISGKPTVENYDLLLSQHNPAIAACEIIHLFDYLRGLLAALENAGLTIAPNPQNAQSPLVDPASTPPPAA